MSLSCRKSFWMGVGTAFTLTFTLTLLSSPSFSSLSLYSPSSPVEAKPGDFATQVIEVISDEDFPPLYNLKLTLPSGWTLLLPPPPVFLPAGVPQYFFITYQIPSSALAGEYQGLVEFIFQEKPLAKVSIITKVSELRSVSIQPPPAKRASPGEVVSYTFLVANRGNVEDTYKVSLFSSPTWKAKPSQSTLSLSPGTTAKLKVTFSVPPAPDVERHFLRIKVKSIFQPQIFAEGRVYTTVLPPPPEQVPRALHAFLPARVRIRGEYDPEREETTSGADFDISGPVDGLGRVSVSASIPDIEQPALQLNSYLLQAYRKDWELSWGDTSASFTGILGASGRGLRIKKGSLWRGRNLTFFSALSGERWWTGAGFELPAEDTLLKIGVLRSREEPDGLAGFFLQHSFPGGWWAEVEEVFTLRRRKKEYAWRGGISYFKENLSLGGKYRYGSPNFPEDISDEEIVSFSSRYTPFPDLRFAVSYTNSCTNVEDDPARPQRKDTTLTFSLLSTFPPLPLYRMELRQKWQRGSRPSLDTLTHTLHFSTQGYIPTPIWPLTYYTWIESGEHKNRLTGEVFNLWGYRGQVGFYRRNFSLWLWQEEGKRWDKDKNEAIFSRSRGMSLGYRLNWKNWKFKLGYSSREEGSWQESFSLSASYPLTPRTYFGVRIKGEGPAEEVKDWIVAFSLGSGFDLPLFWIRTKGTIRGTVFLDRNFNGVFDFGDERLKGLIVSLQGISVSTNEKGEYRFPPLLPGLYRLGVESLPAEWVGWERFPLLVEIEAGEVKEVDIALVQSGTIQGEIYQDTNRNGRRDPQERGVVLARIVTRDTYGREGESFSDNRGQFAFYELFPGSYEVSPDPEWLPERMEFTTPRVVEVKLDPGEVESCQFGVAPAEKKIIITFRPPEAKFTFSPSLPRVGEKVSFDASASFDPDGRVVKYEWDFDSDGKVDTEGVVVKHIFKEAGVYPVVLIVTDNEGNLGFTIRDVEVKSVPPGTSSREGGEKVVFL